jgi:predicted ribosome quality control (RQC) complex YloA/Tae2 family protein
LGKKEFTSFDVAAAVRELEEIMPESRVNNIYQPDAKTLLFKLHKANTPPINLILEAGKRLHLTSYELQKPSTPPMFCMALRKHLRDAWLTNVKQYEFERVVTFEFKTREGAIQLVSELFGDGNFILINEKGIILQALSYRRMRDRNVLRGEVFVSAPPSGKNPFKVSKQELREGLKASGNVEVVRASARFLGIGGTYAEEALLQAGIDKTKNCNALADEDIGALFEVLQSLLSKIANGKLEPTIVLDQTDAFVDVVPFRLKRYEGFKQQSFTTFNEALDEFYIRVKALEKATAGIDVGILGREAERLKRIIESQKKTMVEAEARAEQEKRIGDTIYAHMNEMQTIMDRFSTGQQAGKQWEAIVSEVLKDKKTGLEPASLFESFDKKNLIVNVHIDGLAFGLTLRRSLFENAAEFYERGKQARQKLAGARKAYDESCQKLADVETKIREAEKLETTKPTEAIEELQKRRVKHKEWFEKFRWFVSSDGFLVVAGKDAVSNEVLIKKYTESWDVVFHSDVVGAPFVVVKTEGKEPSEQTLKEATEFAAAFSRGWREGFGSVDVYWVKPEQLSKGGPSGESVGHGAFVVRGVRNWSRGTPLQLAIGVATKNGNMELVGGPVEAIKAKTATYVVIMPGDSSGKELLMRILKTLFAKLPKELQKETAKASIEEIREFVPYGKGRVQEH